MPIQKQINVGRVLKIAGAFIAWMIGSGFSTGQEILQFFSSYGYLSFGVLLINLILFVVLGRMMFATGYDHPEPGFDHFKYYCGKRLGKFYSWLVPVTLILVVAVMTSAAGSTMQEYFDIPKQIGSTLMAVAVVGAYLAGFEKIVGMVSSIGPVIILFALLVGTVTVLKDMGNIGAIEQYGTALAKSNASPHWILSAFSYSSMCIFSAGTYFTALGQSASSKQEARMGATIGGAAFILVLAIMNTAILLNAGEITSQEIPTLYLADRISRLLAGLFSGVLILGMFSTASTMMWSAASRFFREEAGKNRILAILVGIIILILGQFSFSRLLSIVYPLVGYAGFIYLGCVVWKNISKKRSPVYHVPLLMSVQEIVTTEDNPSPSEDELFSSIESD